MEFAGVLILLAIYGLMKIWELVKETLYPHKGGDSEL